jgi:flagellar hook-length control protein FliK
MQPEPLAPVQTDNTPDSGSFSAQSSLSSLAEATLERGPVGTLGAQILDYVHASLARGDRQLLIRLDPPELGSVTMRFQEQRGLIEGVLEVSKDQTRWELEEALPQALRSLQEAGIQIRRLDVMVSDQSEKEPQREQWGQDGSTEHQGSDQRETPPEHMAAGPWSRWTLKQDHNAMGQEPGTAPQMDAAHNRINMLA